MARGRLRTPCSILPGHVPRLVLASMVESARPGQAPSGPDWVANCRSDSLASAWAMSGMTGVMSDRPRVSRLSASRTLLSLTSMVSMGYP